MSNDTEKRLCPRIDSKKLTLRVRVKKLTTIVKNDKDYETVSGDKKPTTIRIKIVDISTGGLCIASKDSFKEGVMLELEIPKIATLDAMILTCEVTRSIYIEDPLYYINMGTDKDKSYYKIGLKTKNQNKYLKQLLELARANTI